jgi:tripartite-type tricarboxylate transporter receptor subunit TctC
VREALHRLSATALRLAALSAAIGCAASVARADSVEDFYRGKTITMYIGTGSGAGAVTGYPEAIAQIIPKYIPGKPNVVVTYMPGAGGIKAANYIYGVAPQDGTAWGFITRGFVLAPLLKLNGVQFNPVKFNWIGSPARAVSVGELYNANTTARSIEDATKTEVVLGATAPNQDTAVFPRALNALVGTKFKIITGYESSPRIDIAMQQKEVQGKVGVTWTSLNSGSTANWIRDKVVNVIVQLGTAKESYIPSDVPLALDLAKTPADRQALYVLCAPTAMGYPSFMGPGVPAERIDAIRKAYAQVLQDPDFKAMTAKEQLDIDPISWTELTDLVRNMYGLPQAAVAQASAIINQAN